MAECEMSSGDLATAFTSSSMNSENVNSDLKKRKTHRLKQRFQVKKKLGQGTYGKVQLAINNETGQEVAIKTIKKSKVSSQQDLVRIRREIQIMSSINHPNIIHIFEVFENKDKIVLVMQYANGGELYDYVSYHKALSDSEARRIFRQVATAIYYCHKNKICHRDLKLENILLDEKGNAKIADFGLSNVFDDKHFLQTFCGSPLYASPEIVRGLPYFGPEVDCWSLGVLLYTLVYGAMPFDGSNFKKLVKQISEAGYFEPAEKSAASDLIHKLLTPDPKERASIIDICTDEWVNKDCDHLLLQVAEDLSNLTKHAVRLDMLLQLAPSSPTSTATEQQNLASKEENETKDEDATNKRPNETVSNNGSLADLPKKPKKKTKKSATSTEQATGVQQQQTDNENLKDEKTEICPTSQQTDQTDPNKTDSPKESSIIENNNTIMDADMEQQRNNDIISADRASQKSNESALEENDQNNQSRTSLKSNESTGSSISKRRGKVSIPKIWDGNQEQQKQQQENKIEKKEPISPGIFSVSELKKELEQKAIQKQQQSPLAKRRGTLADTSELLKPQSTETTADNLKKYKNRSMSLNLNAIQKNEAKIDDSSVKVKEVPIKKLQEAKEDSITSASTKISEIEKTTSSNDEVPEKTNTATTSKTSSTSSIKDDNKTLAKQIIQKNIAKAKLMEKRQTSIQSGTNSGETTPLISIENSTVSIMQGLGESNSNYNSPASSTSNLFFKKPSTVTVKNDFGDVTTPNTASTVTNLPITAAPITRSYKKVVFTKDGAKITETGKFYSHESEDGVKTRVEKKSRITHIVSNNNNNSQNNSQTSVNIQRSDSQSSTGSIDIFDDIFDDHWTGDNLFSNVKSLFSDFFGRPREKFSLRSRAESLERTNWIPGHKTSDSFTKTNDGRKFATSTTTSSTKTARDNLENRSANSSGIFDSQRSSLFGNKSIFSNSFSKSTFGNIDDIINSTRSKFGLNKDSRFSSSADDDVGIGVSGSHRSIFSNRSRLFDDLDDQDTTKSSKIDSNRRRVEQWLDHHNKDDNDDDDNDFDLGIMNKYGTIRPQNTRRYARTMTSNDYKSDVIQKVEISNSSSCKVIEQKTSKIKTENVLPRNTDLQINFSLDGSLGNFIVNQSNVSVLDEKKTTSSSSINVGIPSSSSSDLKIEEPSSLLEQLRTLGYKKLVNRRLSDSSSTEDVPTAAAAAESSTTSSENKSSAKIYSKTTTTTTSTRNQ